MSIFKHFPPHALKERFGHLYDIKLGDNGVTFCGIMQDDTTMNIGIATCKKNKKEVDVFQKARGRQIAEGRAIKGKGVQVKIVPEMKTFKQFEQHVEEYVKTNFLTPKK
jgi:hypothetical protein